MKSIDLQDLSLEELRMLKRAVDHEMYARTRGADGFLERGLEAMSTSLYKDGGVNGTVTSR
jgi:hypothetical protein